MSAGKSTRYISKAGVCCILVLLLSLIIGFGVALADDFDGRGFDERGLEYGLEHGLEHGLERSLERSLERGFEERGPASILLSPFSTVGLTQGNMEFIYISGVDVDVVFNYGLSRSFSVDNGFKTYNFGDNIPYLRNGDIFSFNTSGFSVFSLRIDGNARYLTFDTYDALSGGNVVPVIYPIYSDNVAGNQALFYHYTESFFTSFDDEIFEKMAGHDVVYRFSDNNLRSAYWFDGFRSVTYGSDVRDEYLGFMPLKMVYSVDMSDLQDISLSCLFMCPDHDPTNNQQGNGNPGGVGKGSCDKDLEWIVWVNGEQRNAADYLDITEQDLNSKDFKHVVTFTGLSPLLNDLMNSHEVKFMFYPKGHEETAVLFVFEREGSYVSINHYKDNVNARGKFDVPIYKGHKAGQPALSSLSFPSDLPANILTNAVVLVSDLDHNILANFDPENILEDDNIFVHLFVDINFGGATGALNNYLSANGESVTLTFSVPKQVNGLVVNEKDLKVFHAAGTGDQRKLEELKPVTIINEPDSDYYIVSAETTSFSPFTVLSIPSSENTHQTPPMPPDEIPDSEPARAASSSVASVASGSLNQTSAPPEVRSGSTDHTTILSLPAPPLPIIFESLQGHLSLFSILTVLASSIFMWRYIRRRL